MGGPGVEVAPHRHGGPVAPRSRLHAQESYDVADFPVPTGREEEWRFTPLRRLRGLHDASARPGGKVLTSVWATEEVIVERVGRDDPRVGRAYVPADRVSAQAYASFEEALVITVPAKATPADHISIEVRGGGGEGAAYGHTVVIAEPLARATVVIDHEGAATYADNVELIVGEGASLSVVSIQDWAPTTVHVSHHHAQLDRDARFKSFVVTLGGDLVRLSPSVRYVGPGGDAQLLGLYFVDAGQHLEHRLFVDHAVSQCRSRVDYKGALQGEGAHAVWIGDVIIGAETTGTDTYEHNRNLVLTDGTRVDSVPNLEILTGEVTRAGHASASGRLEDEHLFYLMARGISFEEARRLVIRGFFGQLIDELDVPELRERIAAAVEQELEKSLP